MAVNIEAWKELVGNLMQTSGKPINPLRLSDDLTIIRAIPKAVSAVSGVTMERRVQV